MAPEVGLGPQLLLTANEFARVFAEVKATPLLLGHYKPLLWHYRYCTVYCTLKAFG